MLNEIDYATKLKKRLLPILLEPIEPSLRFQVFNPRFMMIQWYSATGQMDEDLPAILSLIRGEAKWRYQDLVEHTLREFGSDPYELICGLLLLLESLHSSAWVNGNQGYNDNLGSLTHAPKARSIAESLRNYAQLYAAVQHHNAGVRRDKARPEEAQQLEIVSAWFACWGELLRVLVQNWDDEGAKTLQRFHELESSGWFEKQRLEGEKKKGNGGN